MDQYEGKPLSDRRARRIQQEQHQRPDFKRQKIHKVATDIDDEYDDFDPNDIVKAYNAGTRIEDY